MRLFPFLRVLIPHTAGPQMILEPVIGMRINFCERERERERERESYFSHCIATLSGSHNHLHLEDIAF